MVKEKCELPTNAFRPPHPPMPERAGGYAPSAEVRQAQCMNEYCRSGKWRCHILCLQTRSTRNVGKCLLIVGDCMALLLLGAGCLTLSLHIQEIAALIAMGVTIVEHQYLVGGSIHR
jgi:hypothetical protein